MIQFTIDENSPLGRFIVAKAELNDKSPEMIAQEFIEERFKEYILTVHARFMDGEISQGKLADLLDLPRAELIYLLEVLGLPVTNV